MSKTIKNKKKRVILSKKKKGNIKLETIKSNNAKKEVHNIEEAFKDNTINGLANKLYNENKDFIVYLTSLSSDLHKQTFTILIHHILKQYNIPSNVSRIMNIDFLMKFNSVCGFKIKSEQYFITKFVNDYKLYITYINLLKIKKFDMFLKAHIKEISNDKIVSYIKLALGNTYKELIPESEYFEVSKNLYNSITVARSRNCFLYNLNIINYIDHESIKPLFIDSIDFNNVRYNQHKEILNTLLSKNPILMDLVSVSAIDSIIPNDSFAVILESITGFRTKKKITNEGQIKNNINNRLREFCILSKDLKYYFDSEEIVSLFIVEKEFNETYFSNRYKTIFNELTLANKEVEEFNGLLKDNRIFKIKSSFKKFVARDNNPNKDLILSFDNDELLKCIDMYIIYLKYNKSININIVQAINNTSHKLANKAIDDVVNTTLNTNTKLRKKIKRKKKICFTDNDEGGNDIEDYEEEYEEEDYDDNIEDELEEENHHTNIKKIPLRKGSRIPKLAKRRSMLIESKDEDPKTVVDRLFPDEDIEEYIEEEIKEEKLKKKRKIDSYDNSEFIKKLIAFINLNKTHFLRYNGTAFVPKSILVKDNYSSDIFGKINYKNFIIRKDILNLFITNELNRSPDTFILKLKLHGILIPKTDNTNEFNLMINRKSSKFYKLDNSIIKYPILNHDDIKLNEKVEKESVEEIKIDSDKLVSSSLLEDNSIKEKEEPITTINEIEINTYCNIIVKRIHRKYGFVITPECTQFIKEQISNGIDPDMIIDQLEERSKDYKYDPALVEAKEICYNILYNKVQYNTPTNFTISTHCFERFVERCPSECKGLSVKEITNLIRHKIESGQLYLYVNNEFYVKSGKMYFALVNSNNGHGCIAKTLLLDTGNIQDLANKFILNK